MKGNIVAALGKASLFGGQNLGRAATIISVLTITVALSLSLAFSSNNVVQAQDYKVDKPVAKPQEPTKSKQCETVCRREIVGTTRKCISTDLNGDGIPEQTCFDFPVFDTVCRTVCR